MPATVRNSTGYRRERSLIYCVGSLNLVNDNPYSAGVASGDCPFRVVPQPREFVGGRRRRSRTRGLACIVWSVVIAAVMPIVRAIRWQYLLDPVGPTRFGPVLRATIVGFAALALLPARAGDVIRPYLVARKEGLNAASVFATVVMERALDLVAVLTLLASFVWVFNGRASLPPADARRQSRYRPRVAAGVVIALMAVMWTLATHPERIGRLVARSGSTAPASRRPRLAGLARTFSEGFAVAREPARPGDRRRVVVSAVGEHRVSGVACHPRVRHSHAVPASFLIQAMLVIGVAVPTPGGVGSFHEAYRIAVTTFFHAPNDAAVRAAIVLHAVSFFTSLVPGVVIMAHDGMSVAGLGRLAGVARQKETAGTASIDSAQPMRQSQENREVPVLRPSGR